MTTTAKVFWQHWAKRALGEFGIARDTRAGRQRFEQVMERRRFEAAGEACKGLKRGWCFGSIGVRSDPNA
jgi:hypothetical protein